MTQTHPRALALVAGLVALAGAAQAQSTTTTTTTTTGGYTSGSYPAGSYAPTPPMPMNGDTTAVSTPIVSSAAQENRRPRTESEKLMAPGPRFRHPRHHRMMRDGMAPPPLPPDGAMPPPAPGMAPPPPLAPGAMPRPMRPMPHGGAMPMRGTKPM